MTRTQPRHARPPSCPTARATSRLILAVISALMLAVPLVHASKAQAKELVEAEPFLDGLGFVTNMAFAPDGRLFFIQKDGTVHTVAPGTDPPVATQIGELSVTDGGETGLLGLALHPDFERTPWLYVYASSSSETNEILRAEVSDDGSLGEFELVRTLLSSANGYHNGGDIGFGTDSKLYVTTGEIHEPDRAQDPNDLGGKVLRLSDDGSIPRDNPFGPDSAAFSIGHRNSFGICFDRKTGAIWETENGPGDNDELNLIEAGKNYGWPIKSGTSLDDPDFVSPVLNYPQVIVPTGCLALDGDVVFADYSVGQLHGFGAGRGTTETILGQAPAGITDLQFDPNGVIYAAGDGHIWTMPGLFAPKELLQASPSPIRGTVPLGTSQRSWNADGVAATILAVLIVAIGGVAFWRLQQRSEARRTAAASAAADAGGSDAEATAEKDQA